MTTWRTSVLAWRCMRSVRRRVCVRGPRDAEEGHFGIRGSEKNINVGTIARRGSGALMTSRLRVSGARSRGWRASSLSGIALPAPMAARFSPHGQPAGDGRQRWGVYGSNGDPARMLRWRRSGSALTASGPALELRDPAPQVLRSRRVAGSATSIHDRASAVAKGLHVRKKARIAAQAVLCPTLIAPLSFGPGRAENRAPGGGQIGATGCQGDANQIGDS